MGTVVFLALPFLYAFSALVLFIALLLYFVLQASTCTMSTSPPGTYQIRRKPPPLDVSGRYPSPDPSDPFAPLWALRNRTTSGLESDMVNRARSASYLYSTTTPQVPVNTASSPISSESSPLAFQPDLPYRELPSAHRRTNVRFPQRTYDLNDSGTESDANSVPPPNTASYRFPKPSLLKKASFLGSGNGATGDRSSRVTFKQARKLTMPSPVISTAVTWIPSRVGSDFINSHSTSKYTTPDLLDCGLTSNGNCHQHHHNKSHPMSSDGREDLKHDLPRPCKHSSISISPNMSRKRRISFSKPFSFTTAPPSRSSSTFSYVHISMPTLISSSPQPEAAYTSPRKAPAPPPPVSASTLQGQKKICTDKSCGFGYNCIHSISSEWGLPSPLQLNYAARLQITGEDGKQITFGSLFESQPTVVIFIRHFWCPLCQDYMSSVNSSLAPKMICNDCDNAHRDVKGFALGHDAGTRVRFVVISNGAHGMIAKYRQIFGLSFKVYTDPSLALYQALGMGRDKHHSQKNHKHSTSVGSSISEKNSDISKPGEYVKHSLMGGIAMVVMRAFKVGMPVWEKGGDVNQLGGEFVFGPGLTCAYAHRMQTTKGHAPVQDVLKAAGVLAASTPNRRTPSNAEVRHAKPLLPTVPDWTTSLAGSGANERRRRESMHTIRDKESTQSHATSKASRRRYSIGMMTLEDEDRWMEYRHDSIERLRARKDIRRGITSSMGSEQSHWSQQPLEISDIIGDHRRTQSDFTAKTGLAF